MMGFGVKMMSFGRTSCFFTTICSTPAQRTGKSDGICIQNDGFCIKNDEFCIYIDEYEPVLRTVPGGTWSRRSSVCLYDSFHFPYHLNAILYYFQYRNDRFCTVRAGMPHRDDFTNAPLVQALLKEVNMTSFHLK